MLIARVCILLEAAGRFNGLDRRAVKWFRSGDLIVILINC
jgi:hypothetical protein